MPPYTHAAVHSSSVGSSSMMNCPVCGVYAKGQFEERFVCMV
ncbi:hypothetical protein [Bacteroides sp. 1_1_30]